MKTVIRRGAQRNEVATATRRGGNPIWENDRLTLRGYFAGDQYDKQDVILSETKPPLRQDREVPGLTGDK